MSQATPTIYTARPWKGSTVIAAIKDALTAIVSMHSGATAPSYLVTGTLWYDTTNDLVKLYDGSAWIVLFRVNETNDVAAAIPATKALPADDATPSVKGITTAETANANPTTITDFDDETDGQILTLICTDANTTISSGLTATGMTIPLVAGDRLTWVCDGTTWRQIAGNVGMGRFVPVSDEDPIADWIAATVITFTDVDVSDDGVRKGACAVMCRSQHYKNAGVAGIPCVRKNGSSSSTNYQIVATPAASGSGVYVSWTVALDDNAVFEAKFTSDWSASTENTACVIGYWI